MRLFSVLKKCFHIIKGDARLSYIYQGKDSELNSSNFLDDVTSDVFSCKKPAPKIIAVDGAGFGGSSAITDFLGEFANVDSCGGVEMSENPNRGLDNSYEVDFFRDSHGVLDLEKICYHKIGRIRDKAIHDFIDYSLSNYNSGCPFYGETYLNATRTFIYNLLEYSFKYSNGYTCYVPKYLKVSEYRRLASEYIKVVISNITDKDFIVLDCGLSICESSNKMLREYFGDFKKVFNYSDPRDIYARARLAGPNNDWVPCNPEKFVKNWKFMHSDCINNPDDDTIVTCFDEFCNDYEKVAKKLIVFLGLSEENHINKFKYFNPRESINNTKVYKKIENQQAIEYIHENLKEYCWEKE